MNTIEILGLEVDAITAPEALAELRQAIEQNRRAQVVTVNAEMVMRAQRDTEFQRIVNGAQLRVPDGVGLVWAADYLRRPACGALRAYLAGIFGLLRLAVRPRGRMISETVPGAELANDLAAMCEEFGYGLFLLGAGEGVAEAAAAELKKRFPQLQISGAMAGSAAARDDETMRDVILDAEAQVVLVAYGAGKQEAWIARNLPHLPAPCVAVGVGGTLDYWTGAASLEGGRPAKQPPQWVRQRGLESFWRLFTQPSRWRRIMTALPVFANHVIRARIASK